MTKGLLRDDGPLEAGHKSRTVGLRVSCFLIVFSQTQLILGDISDGNLVEKAKKTVYRPLS